MPGVKFAFDTTKEELLRLQAMCDNSGDYTYMDQNIVCMGLNPGIKRAADNMASLLEGCVSLDPNACMRGAGLTFPIKWFLQTPKFILKGIIELISPNIAIAKLVSSILKLAGICLPMPVISFALLPIDVFLPVPIGFGIGPPLYPLGHAYHMMGFGQINLSFGGEVCDPLTHEYVDGECVEKEKTPEEEAAAEQCPEDETVQSSSFTAKASSSAHKKKELPKSSTAQKMAKAVKVVKQQQAQKVKEETNISG
jgi:hypothetical protein